MTTLAIGDTVRIRPGSYRSEWGGEIVATGPGIYTHTVGFSDETQHTYKANELEKIQPDPHDPTRFGLGTRVYHRASDMEGHIDAITSDGYTVAWDGWGTFRDSEYTADELELIDASGEVDGSDRADEPVPGGVAGSPDDDASGAGSEAEPDAEEPPVATPESLEAQVASLTARVNRLLAAGTLQGFISDRHAASINRNDGHLRRLALRLMTMDELPSPQVNHTTTRRMRINITRNTKGYNHDVTFEVTSSDPTLDLQLEMERGLRDADRFARAAIDDAIYTDEHGPPGAEVDDKPF